MNANYTGLVKTTSTDAYGMVFVFDSEDAAEAYADEFLNQGFSWICFSGYFNAFGLPSVK